MFRSSSSAIYSKNCIFLVNCVSSLFLLSPVPSLIAVENHTEPAIESGKNVSSSELSGLSFVFHFDLEAWTKAEIKIWNLLHILSALILVADILPYH